MSFMQRMLQGRNNAEQMKSVSVKQNQSRSAIKNAKKLGAMDIFSSAASASGNSFSSFM